MRDFSVIVVLFLLVVSASANDGAFYANGATLIPMQNTSIRMAREDLQLKRKGKMCLVTVQYVFINEGADTTIDVGFVSSLPEGDVNPKYTKRFPIRNFNIVFNNKRLSGKWKRVSSEDTDSVQLDSALQRFDGSNVFLFKAHFPSGVSIVRHTYDYVIGELVYTIGTVDYTLTSGTLWKGGQIDTFRLTIDMGDSLIVNIPQDFGPSETDLQWKHKGGVVSFDTVKWTRSLVFYNGQILAIDNGALTLFRTNFKPTKDLSIALFDGSWVLQLVDIEGEKIVPTLSTLERALARRYLKETLPLVDNPEEKREIRQELAKFK